MRSLGLLISLLVIAIVSFSFVPDYMPYLKPSNARTWEIFNELNTVRTSKVYMSERLTKAAQSRLDYACKYHNHIGFKELELYDSSEDLAWNQDTPRKVIHDWLNSPPHRRSILNEHYTRVGIATRDQCTVAIFQ